MANLKPLPSQLFKTRVAEIRIGKGLSTIELAGQVGISRQALTSIEKGGAARALTAMAIAKALDVDVAELFQPAE